MTLSEKIYRCRKKKGLSQERLAELIGVSRQSVSKWETGEAEPEIRKLKLLAQVFEVSVDWLLSEAETEETATAEETEAEGTPGRADWLESVPGVVGRMLRRYGWLYGVYVAVSGLGMLFLGALARYMTRRMFSFSPFGGGGFFADGAGQLSGLGDFAAQNPVYIFGGIIMALGAVLIIAGAVIIIVLKKRR